MKKKRIPVLGTATLLLVLLASLLAGCGAGDKGMASQTASAPMAAPYPADTAEYAMDNDTPEAGGAAVGPTLTLPQDDRKIIFTANLYMESLEFDDTCIQLQQAARDAGGRVSGTDIQSGGGSRTASFTVRVPAEKYSDFLNSVAEAGNVTSRNEQSEDVTDQYVDIEARLKSLRTQEVRLLEMMAEAGDLSDIILVQDQLTQVQYEIESYTGYQRSLDNRISYSTVYITLWEVKAITEPEDEGYLAQLGRAFKDSWQTAGEVLKSAGVALVWLLPALLLAGAIVLVVLVATRKARKKRAQNPGPAPMPPYAGTPYAPNASPKEKTAPGNSKGAAGNDAPPKKEDTKL